MSNLLDRLPPRSFLDFTVPLRQDGTPLDACRQEGDYEHYVAWLADYLYETDFPLTPDQSAWLGAADRNPESVVFECSDVFGYSCNELESLTLWFDEGKSHEAYDQEMRSLWEDNTALEDREDSPFEGLTEATFQRLKCEWEQEMATGKKWSHADIPFRPLLARALKDMPDPEERRREIDWFFRNFSDNASK